MNKQDDRVVIDRKDGVAVFENPTTGNSKINLAPEEKGATIGASEVRELLINERHTILMRLAAIEKVLKLDRRCKKCGNDL